MFLPVTPQGAGGRTIVSKSSIIIAILALQIWSPVWAAPSTADIDRSTRQHIFSVEAAGESSLELHRALGKVILAETRVKSLKAELERASGASVERLPLELEQARQELQVCQELVAQARERVTEPSPDWSQAAELFARTANKTRARLHEQLDDQTRDALKLSALKWETSRREFSEAESLLRQRYRDLEEAEERVLVWEQRLNQARLEADQTRITIAVNEFERWKKQCLESQIAIERQKERVAEAGSRVREAASAHQDSLAAAEAVAGEAQDAELGVRSVRISRTTDSPRPEN